MGQIFRFFGLETLLSRETINWSPINAAQLFERFFRSERFALCLQHRAPVRGSKRLRPLSSASENRGQSAILRHDRLTRIDIRSTFNAFRRQLKRPCQDQCYRKTSYEQQNNQTHCPIRNFEKRKNLAGNLHKHPSHKSVGDPDLVNTALL